MANNQQLVNFNNVSDDSVGKTVKWGGVITELHEQDGVANATITPFPLLLSGQPTYMLGSGGTFTARFKSPLNMDNLEQGTVLTLVGKVQELQNPYSDPKTTQLVIVRTDGFYVWDGFFRSKAPIIYRQNPAFIKRGKGMAG